MEKMRAFKVYNDDDDRIEIAEREEDVVLNDGEEIEELCEVEPGCYLYSDLYFLVGEEEADYGDYICQSGQVIGAEDHSGQGMTMGWLDEKRTNEYYEKEGDNPFCDWEFDLWIGSYWDGSNWRVVVKERF